MSTQVADRTARRLSPGDASAPLHQRFDQVARHSLVNSVRRALPGITACEGMRAVRTLADVVADTLAPSARGRSAQVLRNEDREEGRADYLARETDGTMNPFIAPPDGWEARKHAAPSKDGLILKRGKARVIGFTLGDTSAPDAATLPDGIRERLHLALCQLERTNYGASAYDVDRVTDLYFTGEIPRKVGTDAILAHEIGTADDTVDLDQGRWVTGRAHHRPRVPARVSLPHVVGRKSEGVSRRQLAANADRKGYVWIGHTLKPRGVLASKTRKPRTVKADRTIGTVRADNASDLVQHAQGLNRGERVVILFGGHKLTLTRGKGSAGTFSLTTPKGSASGIRTPAAVASNAVKLTN